MCQTICALAECSQNFSSAKELHRQVICVPGRIDGRVSDSRATARQCVWGVIE